mmetsp:Transcript_101674/g.195144  ORF Transcript_101674/g.195144 Transcript_101674/m.195144 type:complete len:262 (-) Transcript_101674:114-899(-)
MKEISSPPCDLLANVFGTCKAPCGQCGAADLNADRIKIDPAVLALGKENSPPVLDQLAEERIIGQLIDTAEAAKRYAAAEVGTNAKAEAERLTEERLHALDVAKECRLEEQRRLEEQSLLEERRQLEERCRLEEERRALEEQIHLEEEERSFAEQQVREALGRAERAKNEAKSKVQKFLKDKGFSGVNEKKTSLMSHKYALHAAVENKDTEILVALLRCKADPSLQNSSKKSPEQLASSVNRNGSHDQVLKVLRAYSQSLK